jgi:hypothetical protein
MRSDFEALASLASIEADESEFEGAIEEGVVVTV